MENVFGDLKPFLAIYPPLSFTFVIQGVFQDEGKPGGETLIYMLSSTSNNCLRNMYIIFLFFNCSSQTLFDHQEIQSPKMRRNDQ